MPPVAIDFDKIRRDYPIEQVASTLLGVKWDKAKSTPTDLWACCPIHAERTPSFHVEGDRFHCFGCGASGDVVELVSQVHGVSTGEAARMITGETKPEPRTRDPHPVRDPYAGYEFGPAPHDAPILAAGQKTPPIRNPKRGTTPSYTPEDVYPYYNSDGELVGYVLRVMIKGEKITPLVLWAREGDWQGWCHASRKDMPLDGLPDLLSNPGKQVLVVEGEKCRKAAAAALQGRVVVVSWCGGTNRLDKTDWTPLHGRSLLLWPDHDEGGYRAMSGGYVIKSGLEEWRDGVLQLAKPSRVKWVRSYDKEKGADVADLLEDGVDIGAYIKANVSDAALVWPKGEHSDPNHQPSEPSRNASDAGRSSDSPVVVNGDGGSDPFPEAQELARVTDDDWEQHLIYTAKGDGIKSGSIQNAMLFLQFDPRFKGTFSYNAFSHRVMLMRKPEWEHDRKPFKPRPMSEMDGTALQGHLEYCGIGLGIEAIERAVQRVAYFNQYNPVRERLESLVWDGVERISKPYGWLTQYLGADNTDINRAFGRKFLISVCARVMQPGCQVDTVMILEGDQGARKSSSLRSLCAVFGEEYFLDNLSDPYGKDGKMAVQGKLLVEFAELEAFSRSEARQEKSYITTRVDEFRPPFARQVREYPRSFVICGTTNQGEASGYLKDYTGGRRFWPVKTDEIDFDLLNRDAEQLWAEAFAAYKDGEQWWLTDTEEAQAEKVRSSRFKQDPWSTLISDHLSGETSTTPNKLLQILEVPRKDRNVYNNERVIGLLRLLGWAKDGEVYRRTT